MIGMIICWWKGKHNWSKWMKLRYDDGRTWYWARSCLRCGRINSTLKEPKMKSEEQIKKEIEALKTVRPNVRSHSVFGDDNLAGVDAQIAVLENDWDNNDIYDEYDRAGLSEEILSSALQAHQWMNDDEDPDCEGLACEWPLKEGGDTCQEN